jgi:cytochrome b6-f complex iron-sulfur subunit
VPDDPIDETAEPPKKAPNPPAQPLTPEHVAPAAGAPATASPSTPATPGTPATVQPGAAIDPKDVPSAVQGPAAPAPAAPRPAPPPKPAVPAVPAEKLAGKTTSVAAEVAKKPDRAPDDSSPLLTRRGWIALAWGSFTAASAAALAATGRFMFPNVLNEPPQQFTIGFPSEYVPGVDERWKEKFGVWIVRTSNDVAHNAPGFYALLVTCTHLGCTPNWLLAENKFKCPCHGSGFRPTGLNFEGPAPRPLERARIVLADDGQILVDKSRKFQQELGQWIDPEAFLRA